mgnify:CR=1 FL=1
MDELYKAHSDLKECAKYEPSALELCTEIEQLVLDLQEAIGWRRLLFGTSKAA